jgi:hypothetical protein
VIRTFAAAAILLGAPPAWTQNEGPSVPNPGNVLPSSVFSDYFARWTRPQTAEAAPRNTQTQRIRAVKAKKPVEPVAQAEPAPAAAPAWPNAEASVGLAGIVPVELKTVRQMAEPESETPLVLENELSDLDIAARPMPIRTEVIAATDGRGTAEEPDFQGSRFVAFVENVRAIGGTSWFEPVLLALAGAMAAVTAMRVFAWR